MAPLTTAMLAVKLRNQPRDSEYDVYYQDKYYKPILKAVIDTQRQMGDGLWRFRDIYSSVCLNLGASNEQAGRGWAPDPYTGTVKDVRGRIRSWIEERSPDSRQYYFSQNRRKQWRENERPLLFVNPGLGQRNREVGWMPYTRVRGNGWRFSPEAANAVPSPSEATLNAAAAAYRPAYGRRGAQNQTKSTASVIERITLRI